MYKQLLLVSTLGFGLAVAPSAMAKSKDDVHHAKAHDRGAVVVHRDGRGHDHDNRDDRHDTRHDGRHDDRHGNRNDARHDNRHDNRHEDRHDHRRDDWKDAHDRTRGDNAHERQWHDTRYRVAPYRAPKGYSHHNWRRGERLPSGYRASRYVVHDYRNYHLHNPPRGHHWVRVDRDVVLTAVGTGIVAAVIYNIFA